MAEDSLSRLARYEALCNGNWCSGPNDGYFYQNLVRLLRDAGRNEELYHLLIGSPDWMNIKFTTLFGDYSYVNDLEMAIADLTSPQTPDEIVRLASLWAARNVVNNRVRLLDQV